MGWRGDWRTGMQGREQACRGPKVQVYLVRNFHSLVRGLKEEEF